MRSAMRSPRARELWNLLWVAVLTGIGFLAVYTARQQEIWNYLVEYVDGHGYPPTVREIGERVGLASPSTVHAHLANLERAGLLRRDPTKPRALELIGRERSEPEPASSAGDGVRLPLVGEIAAGSPLRASRPRCTITRSPSRIPASTIESPLTRSRKSPRACFGITR